MKRIILTTSRPERGNAVISRRVHHCGDRIWEEKSPRRWWLRLLDTALPVTILEWLAKPDLVVLIRHFIVRTGLCRADINKKSVKWWVDLKQLWYCLLEHEHYWVTHVPVPVTKACRRWRYSSTHSQPLHWTEVSKRSAWRKGCFTHIAKGVSHPGKVPIE